MTSTKKLQLRGVAPGATRQYPSQRGEVAAPIANRKSQIANRYNQPLVPANLRGAARMRPWLSAAAIGLVAVLALASNLRAANPDPTRAEKENKLISLLQSDAAPADKAIACKKLAIYGSEKAVPALAALLADPHLASWARIALEAIPGRAADEALRNAMPDLHGLLLVGVINSIGVRQDAQAVKDLIGELKNTDPAVACAAAAALGRIGGNRSARALRRDLSRAPAEVRSEVAAGCVECAEQFLAQGNRHAAIRLCRAVRRARVPEERRIEATRGLILAEGSRGIPLLLGLLRSKDKMEFRSGLTIAREAPGQRVTVALADELRRCGPERQPLLLLALAGRHDDAAKPIIVESAERGTKPMRLAAIQVLERQGKLADVPVLLAAATDNDDQVAQAAIGSLTRFPALGVDEALLGRMPQASGGLRRVLIVLAGRRQIHGAVPCLLKYSEGPDAETRVAALRALAVLGDEAQAMDLAALLQKTQNAEDRQEIEKTLIAICGRSGAASVPGIMPLARNSDPALRVAALHVLAAAGGAEALSAVNTAVQDKDEAVQDEAVHMLASWPNTWPDDAAIAEPLLELAKSGSKPSYRILALRAYLQYIRAGKALNGEDKVAKVSGVLPLLTRPDEKRLAIATVSDIPNAGALKLLTGFAAQPDVAGEACSAIIRAAARKLPGVSREEREQALRLVIEKSTNAGLKTRAETALKSIR
jgi:HEAT repeat protein